MRVELEPGLFIDCGFKMNLNVARTACGAQQNASCHARKFKKQKAKNMSRVQNFMKIVLATKNSKQKLFVQRAIFPARWRKKQTKSDNKIDTKGTKLARETKMHKFIIHYNRKMKIIYLFTGAGKCVERSLSIHDFYPFQFCDIIKELSAGICRLRSDLHQN